MSGTICASKFVSIVLYLKTMLPANMVIFHEMERFEQLRLAREESRFLRDRSDPFSLTDRRFVEIFRLNKDIMQHLSQELIPFMDDSIRNSRIHYQRRIMTAIRFFATGAYQQGVGQEYLLALSQPMVSRCVSEVSQIIQNHFGPNWIKFPNENEMQINKRFFFEKCGLPGTIAAIDCTHVAIIAPLEEEHNYINRKGYHSINVQFICDTDLLILNVNARFPGCTHDSFIWRQSTAQAFLQRKFENGTRSTWLLGDSGYPQQPWLMTPVQGALPNTPEGRYNIAHCIGRNHIERLNGVLKTRFRCLLGERKLRYAPAKVGFIINTCSILHNMCIKARIAFDEPAVPQAEPNYYDGPINDFENINMGRQIRGEVINNYFRV